MIQAKRKHVNDLTREWTIVPSSVDEKVVADTAKRLNDSLVKYHELVRRGNDIEVLIATRRFDEISAVLVDPPAPIPYADAERTCFALMNNIITPAPVLDLLPWFLALVQRTIIDNVGYEKCFILAELIRRRCIFTLYPFWMPGGGRRVIYVGGASRMSESDMRLVARALKVWGHLSVISFGLLCRCANIPIDVEETTTSDLRSVGFVSDLLASPYDASDRDLRIRFFDLFLRHFSRSSFESVSHLPAFVPFVLPCFPVTDKWAPLLFHDDCPRLEVPLHSFSVSYVTVLTRARVSVVSSLVSMLLLLLPSNVPVELFSIVANYLTPAMPT